MSGILIKVWVSHMSKTIPDCFTLNMKFPLITTKVDTTFQQNSVSHITNKVKNSSHVLLNDPCFISPLELLHVRS